MEVCLLEYQKRNLRANVRRWQCKENHMSQEKETSNQQLNVEVTLPTLHTPPIDQLLRLSSCKFHFRLGCFEVKACGTIQ